MTLCLSLDSAGRIEHRFGAARYPSGKVYKVVPGLSLSRKTVRRKLGCDLGLCDGALWLRDDADQRTGGLANVSLITEIREPRTGNRHFMSRTSE